MAECGVTGTDEEGRGVAENEVRGMCIMDIPDCWGVVEGVGDPALPWSLDEWGGGGNNLLFVCVHSIVIVSTNLLHVIFNSDTIIVCNNVLGLQIIDMNWRPQTHIVETIYKIFTSLHCLSMEQEGKPFQD